YVRWSSVYLNLHSFPTRRSSDLQSVLIKGFVIVKLFIRIDAFSEKNPIILIPVRHDHASRRQNLYACNVFFKEIIVVNFPENFRSEEHTSELQSRENLVCRLLLE